MNYDFSTLSPEDFERLCADVFSAEWGAQLELFKAGKDGGIDLRHSRYINKSESAIIQCKRYASHKFNELRLAMVRELPKIKELNPSRYILATSVRLSSKNKTAIIDDLSPYISGPADIYGADEINSLLTKHSYVLKSHFKLWVSSTEVLERVLHARIFNITEATIESLKSQMSRLVVHGGFDRALSLLSEKNHCVIAGNPGIGKTTLARMLMCHYLKDGYVPLVVIGDIDDAWTIVSDTQNKKQKFVVLYDDFLGTFGFEENKFGKNEDSSLMSFVKRAIEAKNIKLLMTTREYIFADAQKLHGSFEKDAAILARCTVHIEDYVPPVRAEVLFNHLYFSDIDEERLNLFVKQKVYRELVSHNHFNPRIIEAISNQANSFALTAGEYIEYIKAKFDDPSDLWMHPFENQISSTARQILAVLWSLGGAAELGLLKEAASAFCGDAAVVFAANFKSAMKELTGNFVISDKISYGYGQKYALLITFQNPSVAEFIYKFVSSEPSWIEELASNARFFRQIVTLFAWAESAQKKAVATDADIVSPHFIHHLHDKGRMAEFRQLGSTFNYAGKGVVFTENDMISSIERLNVLLKISELCSVRDERTLELVGRVVSIDGWRRIVSVIPNAPSEVYALARFAVWISASTVFGEQKVDVIRSLGLALDDLFSDDDVKNFDFSDIKRLWECYGLAGLTTTTEQVERFIGFVEESAIIMIDCEDSFSRVDDAADVVLELGKTYAFEDGLVGKLQMRAEELREGYDWEDDSNASFSYNASHDQSFDIDVMFSALVDK